MEYLLVGIGMGGGSVLILILVTFMKVAQHSAQQLNLLYYIPTAIIAIMVHRKNETIEKDIAKKMLLPSVIGSATGAYIATLIQANQLKKFFGIFLLGIRNI